MGASYLLRVRDDSALGDASRTLTRSVERKAARVWRTRTKDCCVLVKSLLSLLELVWSSSDGGTALREVGAFGAFQPIKRGRPNAWTAENGTPRTAATGSAAPWDPTAWQSWIFAFYLHNPLTGKNWSHRPRFRPDYSFHSGTPGQRSRDITVTQRHRGGHKGRKREASSRSRRSIHP